MYKRSSSVNQKGATRQNVTLKNSKKTRIKANVTSSFVMSLFFRQHREIFLKSLSRLLVSPLSSFMTLMVIAVALSLPGGLYVMLKNVQSVTSQWEQQSIISLYLFAELEDTEALALSHELSARSDVESVSYVSKEEGLRSFEQVSGYEHILSSLPENPLPIVLKVTPTQGVSLSSLDVLERQRVALEALNAVEYAELDAQWLQRLASFLNFGRQFVYALSLLLIVAVFLIVGNTIRSAVESRRDEITVMKMIGATDGYIRRPFLYMGLWFGILGGSIAILFIIAVSYWVGSSAADLIDLYHSNFELVFLSFKEFFMCLLVSSAIGVIGSWIAVNQHIAAIDLQ
ncbi:cell division protein FtsX [Marinomonas agarivorans]|nr:cell division protein FtsX [Marinomonas agarivorans]